MRQPQFHLTGGPVMGGANARGMLPMYGTMQHANRVGLGMAGVPANGVGVLGMHPGVYNKTTSSSGSAAPSPPAMLVRHQQGAVMGQIPAVLPNVAVAHGRASGQHG